MTSKYRLVMRSGPTAGKSFVLDTPEAFIGRDLNNEIVINDPEVSRRHTRLFLQGASYVVEDLGSTNGTSVNGQRLMGPYTLRPGELIMLGENVSLLYELVQTGPNETIASSSRAQPPTMQAPPQQVPAMESFPDYMSGPPPAAPLPAAPAYSGHIPSSPIEEAPKKKFPIWIIVVGLLLIIACFCIGFLVYVDASNAWCDWFGWLFNMFTPGLCP